METFSEKDEIKLVPENHARQDCPELEQSKAMLSRLLAGQNLALQQAFEGPEGILVVLMRVRNEAMLGLVPPMRAHRAFWFFQYAAHLVANMAAAKVWVVVWIVSQVFLI